MSDSRRSSHNSTVMIVVVVAGLACGGVVAWQLTGAGRAAPEPDPPVLESQRLPWDTLHPEEDEPVPADAVEAPPADEARVADQPEEYDPVAERVVVQAERRAEDAGVTEFVELDDELFIRVSAKVVIMASALAGRPDGRDLLVDYEAGLLAEEKINPDDWYEYAKAAARDPRRTEQLGEAILREAEKHTEMSINVHGVTDLSPSQAAGPADE